jgi:uncharacterized membrane protein YfcA
VLRLAAIGLAAGLFGAILGVGGGIVVVPLLVYLFHYDQRRAAATSMGAIAITATVGAISYGIEGHLHPYAAALVGIPAAFGVVAGTAIQQRLPLRALQVLFAGLLVVVGIRLLAPQALPFHAIHHRSAWVYAVVLTIGLVGGVLAGIFGVGGGILFVPTFVLLLGIGQLEAGATSLLAMLPASCIGAWRQQRYGNLNGRAALTIGIVSIAGVQAGIAIAERLDESTLQRIFGVLLMVTAAQIAWRASRR